MDLSPALTKSWGCGGTVEVVHASASLRGSIVPKCSPQAREKAFAIMIPVPYLTVFAALRGMFCAQINTLLCHVLRHSLMTLSPCPRL